MSTLSTVQDLKVALLKALPAQEDGDTETCRDILKQLDSAAVTLDILTETLIGKHVSTLKAHSSLGPTAKTLVKKWKRVAAAANITDTSTSTKKTSSASRKVKAERRDSSTLSTGSAAPDPSQEWAGLPSNRTALCRKLYSLLIAVKKDLTTQRDATNDNNDASSSAVMHPDAFDHLCGPRAAEIESAVYQKLPLQQQYTDKARSLSFNLKKNTVLCQQVVLGQVSAVDLVGMSSEQLAPAATREARAAEAAKLQEAKRLDWNEANEDKINEMCGIRGDLLKASLFTCGRCKSIKTTSTQKQTRSADEPMTVFVLCLNCGKRWKC